MLVYQRVIGDEVVFVIRYNLCKTGGSTIKHGDVSMNMGPYN